MFRPSHTFGLSLLTLFSLALSTSTAQAEEEKVQLRYQFKPGQIVRYSVHMRDDYSFQIAGATATPFTQQDSTKSYRVMSVKDDGAAVLQLTIESTKIIGQENGQDFEFDSKKPKPDNELFAAMAATIGKPRVEVTVSSTGEVLSFDNLLLKGQQDVEGTRQAAMDVLLRLPEEPIAVGTSWREDFQGTVSISDSGLKKPVKMQRRYYFKSHENNLATIELKTSIITKLSPEEEIQTIRRQPQGTIVIDTAKGLQVSKSLTQNNTVQNFQSGPCVATFTQKQTETFVEEQIADAGGQTIR